MIYYDVELAMKFACAIDRMKESDDFSKQTRRTILIDCLSPYGAIEQGVRIEPCDIEFANTIKEYCKRYVADILSSTDGKLSAGATLYSIFTLNTMAYKHLKLVAESPIFYRDQLKLSVVEKLVNLCDNEHLFGNESEDKITDIPCVVIDTTRTSNYPGWNITGVIDNKLVSWYSYDEYCVGTTYRITARIKHRGENWTFTTMKETRLHWVRRYYENTN